MKAASNLVKHGVSFPEAATVFADPLCRTVYRVAGKQAAAADEPEGAPAEIDAPIDMNPGRVVLFGVRS